MKYVKLFLRFCSKVFSSLVINMIVVYYNIRHKVLPLILQFSISLFFSFFTTHSVVLLFDMNTCFLSAKNYMPNDDYSYVSHFHFTSIVSFSGYRYSWINSRIWQKKIQNKTGGRFCVSHSNLDMAEFQSLKYTLNVFVIFFFSKGLYSVPFENVFTHPKWIIIIFFFFKNGVLRVYVYE